MPQRVVCAQTRARAQTPGLTYTVADLAADWLVSKDLVYELIRRGALPAFRVGKHIRVTGAARAEYEARTAVEVA